MRFKTTALLLLLFTSLNISAQVTEVKGIITLKTIKKTENKTISIDTITANGARTMVYLFNKMDSKLIAIADTLGYYYFIINEKTAHYTHIQFLNIEGGSKIFPIKHITYPFFDIELLKMDGFKPEELQVTPPVIDSLISNP